MRHACARSNRRLIFHAMFALALTTLGLTLGLADGRRGSDGGWDKEQALERMSDLGKQWAELRQQPQTFQTREMQTRLLREYRELSRALGGDDPAGLALGEPRPPVIGDEGAIAAAPLAPAAPAGCTASTVTFSKLNPVPIPVVPNAVIASTIVVAGASAFVWDVDLTTFIQHSAAGDLDITLTSPAGTIVTITTDNGGTNDNVFNGTLWDDDANPGGQVPYASNAGLVTDATYVNGVVQAALAPEEAMGAFFGENPNGNWTLRVFDDVGGDSGTLTSWALDITTIASAPTITAPTFSLAPALAIASGPSLTTSDIIVSGAQMVLTDVNVRTLIDHTAAADLDITLRSPAGTIVTLTSDNGGTNDNVYANTLWDDDADPDGALPYTTNDGLVTDALYANNVIESPLVPEEAMAAFIGENPNGTWTLTISDDAASNGGTLQEWGLDLQATLTPPVTSVAHFETLAPQMVEPPLVISSTVTVTGVAAYLWDVDLSAFFTHSANGDLDMTLTSPAGTTVTLTTDNGANSDNVFNGTLWDDQADSDGLVPYSTNEGLVNDGSYANNIVETPVVGEEGFGAFIGENPNGVWTLTVADDMPTVDGGSQDEWTLHITTLSAAPTFSPPVAFNSDPLALVIPATGPPNVTISAITVSGVGAYLGDLVVSLNVAHSFSGDLDITLTSPAGRNVTLTTDNGAAFDNVFAGTVFDDDADPDGVAPYVFNDGLATDHNYIDFVVPAALAPEEALASMIGQDPNGDWTLTISDDSVGDGGVFNSWSLSLRTCECGGGLPCPANIATGPGSETVVNIDDLLAVISAWGPCPTPPAPCPENIATGPGSETVVNIDDLLAVISAWGPCP